MSLLCDLLLLREPYVSFAIESVSLHLLESEMDPFIVSLRKKLQEFQQKRASALKRLSVEQATITELHGAIVGIETLLRMEGGTDAPADKQGQLTLPTLKQGQPTRLKDLLKTALSDGKPRRLQELIADAQNRGYDFGEKEPKKAVNFTLMGIANGKTIKRLGNDIWQAAGH
jgi:hypothetical protein